jgi:hypothetical protein
MAFDADGEDGFVDGSLAADLPFERIATLFNASNFIVSQGSDSCGGRGAVDQ